MPNRKLAYKRGEVWWINLNPAMGNAMGNETGKERPCLILQNDVGNKNGATTIVAPLLPGTKTYPYVVNISPTPQNGMKGDRYVNLGQIRVIDARRIKNRQGILEDIYWDSIERAVLIQLGFSPALKSS